MRLWLLGAALLALGLVVGFHPGATRNAERVASLPQLKASEWRAARLDQSLLLEGTVSPQERTNQQGFVVYLEERYRGRESDGATKGRDIWHSQQVARPAFALSSEGQLVSLCNTDYLLEGALHHWQSESVPTSRGLFEESTIRRSGLRAGDPVVFDGIVRTAAGQRCVQAKSVFGGTTSQYLEHARSGTMTMRVVGAVFALLGLTLLGLLGFARARQRAEE